MKLCIGRLREHLYSWRLSHQPEERDIKLLGNTTGTLRLLL